MDSPNVSVVLVAHQIHENVRKLCKKYDVGWFEIRNYWHGIIHGPAETYDEDGQLKEKGRFNIGEKCGEWIEDGETVTYDPCPDTEN